MVLYVDVSLLIRMASSRKFESVFCADNDEFRASARLNYRFNRFDLYAIGYKDAADRLVELVLSDSAGRDTQIYPITFLYRQYIELRLKQIIKEGRILMDESEKLETMHYLKTLWTTAKKVINKIFEHEYDPSDSLQYAEHVILEFDKIDPNSTIFRYPIDKEGNQNFTEIEYVNIRVLALHVNELSEILDGITSSISAFLDDKGEMLSYSDVMNYD